MKKLGILVVLLCPLSLLAEEAVIPAAQTSAERNKMLYSLGFMLGTNLQDNLILDNENDFKAVSQGMRDSLLGKEAQIDVLTYRQAVIQKYQTDTRLRAQQRQAEQQDYLANFQKEKGVKMLDNGAMIKLTRAGKGKAPKADGKATVHYTGTLINGKQFDSSRDRNQPFTTALNKVIPCWTKALQQMKPGSRAKVVCPADTAYGNHPLEQIPANSVLVFDIEMLSAE